MIWSSHNPHSEWVEVHGEIQDFVRYCFETINKFLVFLKMQFLFVDENHDQHSLRTEA